jgi:transcription initiation factor IIE alpha subunit
MTYLPYQAHSTTSHEAAESMRGKAPSVREKVLAELRRAPATDEELVARLGISQNTVRPRRVELLQAGMIAEVGRRATSSGRYATVWSALPEWNEVFA